MKNIALMFSAAIIGILFASCGAVEIQPKEEITKRMDSSCSDSLPDDLAVGNLDSAPIIQTEAAKDSNNKIYAETSKTTTTKKKKSTVTESADYSSEGVVTTIIPATDYQETAQTTVENDLTNSEINEATTTETERPIVNNEYGLTYNELLYENVLDNLYKDISEGQIMIDFSSAGISEQFFRPDVSFNVPDVNNYGYTFIDLNSDGTDELIVSKIISGNDKWTWSYIYCSFTVKNGIPSPLKFSSAGGGTPNYYLLNNNSLLSYQRNGITSTIMHNIRLEYDLSESSNELRTEENDTIFYYNGSMINKNDYDVLYSEFTDFKYLELKSLASYKQ